MNVCVMARAAIYELFMELARGHARMFDWNMFLVIIAKFYLTPLIKIVIWKEFIANILIVRAQILMNEFSSYSHESDITIHHFV